LAKFFASGQLSRQAAQERHVFGLLGYLLTPQRELVQNLLHGRQVVTQLDESKSVINALVN
jgi:hypothetical protein